MVRAGNDNDASGSTPGEFTTKSKSFSNGRFLGVSENCKLLSRKTLVHEKVDCKFALRPAVVMRTADQYQGSKALSAQLSPPNYSRPPEIATGY
jgi:hypothetical protein